MVNLAIVVTYNQIFVLLRSLHNLNSEESKDQVSIQSSSAPDPGH